MLDTDRSVKRYENLLRAVGAHLDSQNARHVCVVETLDGFVARYQDASRGELHEAGVSFEHLQDRFAALLSGRGFGQLDGVDARYQDFLRALGHNLDAARAGTVLLDELSDGFLLSFEYYEPQHIHRLGKRQLLLGPDEQEIILEKAHARRAPDPDLERNGLFAWLFH